MQLRLSFGFAALFATFAVVACGTETSEFPSDGSSGNPNSNGGSSGPGIGASGGSDGGVIDDGEFAKCAEARDAAKRLPLHLVLLLDRSSSMCRYDGNNDNRNCAHAESRWAVTATALNAFFSSPETEGITLSLIPFPKPPTADGDLRTQCLADYSEEAVFEQMALPSSQVAAQLESAKPAAYGWVTPTTPAVEGALEFARDLKRRVPAEDTVAVLFATDGQPKDCNPNRDPSFTYEDGDIGPASQLAQQGKQNDDIATYVIGLDDPSENLRANLEALAGAAGTSPPALISLQDSSAAVEQLKEALNAIRGKALGCELIVPPPPEGKTLDPKKVNVVYVPSTGGDPIVLPYSENCSDSGGWYYDNPEAPTRITLCSAACVTAQDDPGGRLEVVLGCETQGGPIN